MNIANALNMGSTEYKDDGVIIQHPPTALAIMAAKHIQTLVATHENNVRMIMSLQRSEDQLLQENEQLRTQQKALYAELLIKDENERNQSVRYVGQEAGDVDNRD